jgi:hypothetical protein
MYFHASIIFFAFCHVFMRLSVISSLHYLCLLWVLYNWTGYIQNCSSWSFFVSVLRLTLYRGLYCLFVSTKDGCFAQRGAIDTLMPGGRPRRGVGTSSRAIPSTRRAALPTSHDVGVASSVPPPYTGLLGRKRKSTGLAACYICAYFCFALAHHESYILLFLVPKIGDNWLPLLSSIVTAFNRKKRRFFLDLLRSGYACASSIPLCLCAFLTKFSYLIFLFCATCFPYRTCHPSPFARWLDWFSGCFCRETKRYSWVFRAIFRPCFSALSMDHLLRLCFTCFSV